MDTVKHGFKEAQTVRLKSGSPFLTVEELRQDDVVAVVWFDAAGVCHRDAFHHLALVTA